jgi:methionyl-tRNA formyltransferase
MRLVFAGTPQVALPSLRALLASTRHDVVAAVTRPDSRSGRGRRRTRSPVGELADAHGVEVLSPERAADRGFLDRLAEIRPECCPVVGYGALLPEAALAIPRHGWVNLHFSLLPAWRGAAPVPAAIRHGDGYTGATTFRVVRAMDAGPVFGVLTEQVGDRDTAGTLGERLAHAGADLLTSTLDGIADGSLAAVEQAPDGVSYAGKVDSADAEVDFTAPAFAVDRLVRACTPTPGAWTTVAGARLKLGPVEPTGSTRLPAGELVANQGGVLVGTGTTAVRLGDVQPPGRTWMRADAWARGARLGPGTRVGAP